MIGGWTEFQFAERRMPTLDEINDAAPDTPVFVMHLYDRALLNAAALRAVIFDLWDTLALWPSEAFEEVKRLLRTHITDDVWDATYDRRQSGPLDDYFRGLGLDDGAVDTCIRLRSDFTRAALVPREGAIETLEELGIRGGETFLSAGGEQFARLDCLNDSSEGMDMLTALIRRELAGWLPQT